MSLKIGNIRHWEPLDHNDNVDLWTATADASLSARERRILITHWVGKAWEKIHEASENYSKCLWRYFEKTGCLITADGSGDEKINPEGLQDYKVPPPTVYLAPPECEIDCETPAPAELEPDTQMPIPDHQIDDDEPERVDKAEERDYKHENIGRNIKALYDNGWHIGSIKYFCKNLNEFKIDYPDGSIDYISPNDIDGFEVILV